jgi:hypothetical protein
MPEVENSGYLLAPQLKESELIVMPLAPEITGETLELVAFRVDPEDRFKITAPELEVKLAARSISPALRVMPPEMLTAASTFRVAALPDLPITSPPPTALKLNQLSETELVNEVPYDWILTAPVVLKLGFPMLLPSTSQLKLLAVIVMPPVLAVRVGLAMFVRSVFWAVREIDCAVIFA